MVYLIRHGFFAACVLMGVSLYAVSLNASMGSETAVLLATVLSLLAAVVLERLLPFRKDWNQPKGDTGTDITSAVVLVALVDPLLKYAAPWLVVAAYSLWGSDPASPGPAGWNLGLQLVLVILLVEFGKYWAHRAHHQISALWWLHALHHSSERLYTINNLRFHPLNHALNFLLGILPVMLLGFSADALWGYLAISQPVLILQHANIDLKSGWLNYVFSTNEVHRWHHSKKRGEADHNFGSAFLIWDQVFGTFRADQYDAGQDVGLFGEGQYYPARSDYFRQLLSMFKPGCCRGTAA